MGEHEVRLLLHGLGSRRPRKAVVLAFHHHERREVSLSGGAQIDLGGIAKGYTGDMVLSLLRKAGVKSAIVNLGGNVQTLGSKPDGSAWRIGILRCPAARRRSPTWTLPDGKRPARRPATAASCGN